MHRFAMKEELGELIFEVLFFVYVKSIRNDELDVFCCWDSLILWIIQLILILYYFLLCTILYLFSYDISILKTVIIYLILQRVFLINLFLILKFVIMNKLTRLKRCKRCISTLMLMCCSLLVWAQNTVTGTVLDESNLEVIGANVKEKGTANGAITDMNGVFI